MWLYRLTTSQVSPDPQFQGSPGPREFQNRLLEPANYFKQFIGLASFPVLNSLANARNRSRARFINHCLPDALGFQDHFHGFADRTVAGHSFRRVVGSFLDFGYGISDCYGQSDATQ